MSIEGVQIKMEPSTRLRSGGLVASSSPESVMHVAFKRESDAPIVQQQRLDADKGMPQKRRKVSVEPKVEPKVKVECAVEPKVEVEGVTITPKLPFPDFVRPTPEECRVSSHICRQIKANFMDPLSFSGGQS